ncbi:eCIS core domain-containing protein [Micromonospora sp. CPCC 206061]|uniref:eCIS core domain-containing protein n=1 Tax=Micromonospora sp. CPCC 206061 TaxID=3122410 RepID=UPI002FF1C2B3
MASVPTPDALSRRLRSRVRRTIGTVTRLLRRRTVAARHGPVRPERSPALPSRAAHVVGALAVRPPWMLAIRFARGLAGGTGSSARASHGGALPARASHGSALRGVAGVGASPGFVARAAGLGALPGPADGGAGAIGATVAAARATRRLAPAVPAIGAGIAAHQPMRPPPGAARRSGTLAGGAAVRGDLEYLLSPGQQQVFKIATGTPRKAGGPAFRPPQGAGDLPVLGGALLPPGTTPDPTGAVETSPARPASAIRSETPARQLRPAPPLDRASAGRRATAAGQQGTAARVPRTVGRLEQSTLSSVYLRRAAGTRPAASPASGTASWSSAATAGSASQTQARLAGMAAGMALSAGYGGLRGVGARSAGAAGPMPPGRSGSASVAASASRAASPSGAARAGWSGSAAGDALVRPGAAAWLTPASRSTASAETGGFGASSLGASVAGRASVRPGPASRGGGLSGTPGGGGITAGPGSPTGIGGRAAHLAGRGASTGVGAPVGGRGASGGTGAGADGAPVVRRAAAASPEQSADIVGGLPVASAGGHKAESLSPQRRWEAAVAARPLEAPQALPARFHALASAATGAALPPRYTTGPATRHALASAGALGATTGSVVHLPAPPARVPVSVLAHELSHARQPVSRPRFLLASMSGAVDDDERGALAAGRGLITSGTSAAGLAGGGGPETGAGLVDRLPVGGGVGAVSAVTEVATRAARAAVIEAGASPSGGMGLGGMGLGGMGLGGMGLGGMGLGGMGLGGMGLGGMGLGGMGFGDLAGGFPSGGGNSAATNAPTSAPESGTSGTVSGGTVAANDNTSAAVAGTAGGNAGVDMDMVVEAVEERLLREIERRGGRWAGVF